MSRAIASKVRAGDAVEALANVLERENAALQQLDLPTAVALVPEKETAIQRLSRESAGPPVPEQSGIAERLIRLTRENHALLERAIKVQARVIEIVARSYKAPPELRTYGPNGAPSASRASGVAFSSRV
jgi:hypothetical protein